MLHISAYPLHISFYLENEGIVEGKNEEIVEGKNEGIIQLLWKFKSVPAVEKIEACCYSFAANFPEIY